MKNLIGIIVLLLINMSAFGNGLSDVKPELKVMSKSGLKLRLSPNLDSPVLEVIQYGETIFLEEDSINSREAFNVSWTKGKWIKVQYENQVGFVFDGFVSSLPVPLQDTEFAATIGGLGEALYYWAYNNFDLISTDTLTDNDMALTTVTKLGDNELFLHDTELTTRIDFQMKDIRIMDAYHLLESMMDSRSSRAVLKENSMFFSGVDGELNKIKIGMGLVTIKKLENGEIKVSCKTIHEGC
jgi:hypothetical protein